MSAIDLRNLIVRNILSQVGDSYNLDSQPIHESISNAITEYMTTYVKLNGSYSGTTPAGTPESAPSDTWNIVGSMPVIPVPSDFDSWMKSIDNGIKIGFYTGSGISHPLSPVPAFPNMNSDYNQDELSLIHSENYSNPMDPIFLRISEWITDGLMKGYVSSVPAGIAGSGVFSVSNVTI